MNKMIRDIYENLAGFLGLKEESESCVACNESFNSEAKGFMEIFAEKEKLCLACRSQLIPMSEGICIKCGRYLNWRKKEDGEGLERESQLLCENCKAERIYYNIVISCYEYSGYCKELLHRLKYSNEPELAAGFGKPMANALGKNSFYEKGIFSDSKAEKRLKESILVPVPISDNKMKSRGYNQALLLAREIEKVSGIKVVDALSRKKDTEGQHMLTKNQRNLNILGAFSRNLEYNISDKYIILVDDIFTTGSTANECAKVLKAAGSKEITVLTAAGGGKKSL